MKISRMANSIEPSLTRKLFNMAQKYDDVINLTLGDPDLLTPENIRKAGCEAIMRGDTRYSANAGLIQLREAISKNFLGEYGFKPDPNNEVIITVGGMEGLFLSLASIIDEGDEVIIPAPYYVNYVQMVKMLGGIPVIVETNEVNGFSVTAESLKSVVNNKTIAIIINTPANPTGEVISYEVLEKIAEIAIKNDLIVITDEVYKSLVYDGKTHNSIITVRGMRERTVLIDSLSKKYSMTGYRIGYVVAPAELIESMTKMQENVVACAPLPSQYAAIDAYKGQTDTRYIYDEFLKRRDLMYNGINSIEGLSCRKPAGAFYLFVNISKTGLSSVDFAYKLLEQQHVAVVPGIAYGTAYDNYIRIAFTLEQNLLRESLKKIEMFVDSVMNDTLNSAEQEVAATAIG